MGLGRLDHFEVLRFLGRGGLSDVYLARDTHLDCDVALKVLREDHAGDDAHRRRLLAEARALARLDHANVVGILDCGEAAPDPPDFLWPGHAGPHPARVVYLAMRFVPGRDLSEVLSERRLTVAQAVDWTLQLARGLEAAHERHVVHRDLKPANVRVTPEGELKIVDFGLASSRRHAVGSETPTETPDRDVVVGTIGYSAPEQSCDADHADPRCDLFSLGAIAYEMVTGHPAFAGKSALAVMQAIATTEPPPLARSAVRVPAELERIVTKLLVKDPRHRYQSAREVVTDLERLTGLSHPRPAVPRGHAWVRYAGPAALAALGVLLLVGVPRWVHRGPPETVAVVEFENQTGDPSLDRLARGLGLDLVTSMVQSCRVNVVSSVLRDAAGVPVRDPAKVAHEYGATTVLLGTLEEGGRDSPAPGVLSLHVRTVRAADNATNWAERLDAPAHDVAGLVHALTEAALAHWPRVAHAATLPATEPGRDAGLATEAYLRGRALLDESDPVLRDSSLAWFDRALELAPESGRALAGRARAQLAAYLRDRDTTRLAPAMADARRAAAAPDAEVEGHIALARLLLERGRFADAAAELRTVLAHHEQNGEALSLLGSAEWKRGELASARRYYRAAVDLQPGSPRAWRAYGRFLLLGAADFEAAEAAFRREIALTPGENRGWENLAAVYVQSCRFADALATYAKLPKPDQGSLDRAGNRGTASFFAGDLRGALRDYLQATAAAPEDADWRVNLGDCYARMGRAEEALREYRLAAGYYARDRVTSPEDAMTLARHAKALAKCRDTTAALGEARRLVARGPWTDADLVHELAMTLALCGERDAAVAALDTLVRARGFHACLVAAEDEFASLRTDPRFRRLAGLPR